MVFSFIALLKLFIDIKNYSENVNVPLPLIYNIIVDMMERCIMCGAEDDSLNHPDYSDWLSSSQLL